jgi:hypothetical protein
MMMVGSGTTVIQDMFLASIEWHHTEPVAHCQTYVVKVNVTATSYSGSFQWLEGKPNPWQLMVCQHFWAP